MKSTYQADRGRNIETLDAKERHAIEWFMEAFQVPIDEVDDSENEIMAFEAGWDAALKWLELNERGKL